MFGLATSEPSVQDIVVIGSYKPPRTLSAAKIGQDDAGPDFGDYIQAIAADRDIEAFNLLFQAFAPRVKAYGLRLGASPEVAEDLVQEVMVAVWRKAHTFDRAKAAASTWIFTIARNKRIDGIRREKRPELDPNDPWFQPEPEATADRHIEHNRLKQWMDEHIRGLPNVQSDILRRAFFDDQTHSAIAEELGVPIGTVKSRIRLALKKLRLSYPGDAP